jgi:hypothetical protein
MALSVSSISLLLIAVYFVFLLISLLRRGKVISGPWLFLLRSFFPNWRFYHGLGHQPRLFVRTLNQAGEWQAWQMFMPRAAFHLADLVHNPRNNLLLAHQNLVDHLSADVQAMNDNDDVRDLVSYQLVDRLARSIVKSTLTPHQGHEQGQYQYQFQVRLVPPEVRPDESMALLTSPAYST